MEMQTYKVWYWRSDFATQMLLGNVVLIDGNNLERTHIYLKDVVAPNMESVYRIMQGENWSPNGEARPLIESKGLSHTSMSGGDLIVDEAGKIWAVAAFGFTSIGKVETRD